MWHTGMRERLGNRPNIHLLTFTQLFNYNWICNHTVLPHPIVHHERIVNNLVFNKKTLKTVHQRFESDYQYLNLTSPGPLEIWITKFHIYIDGCYSKPQHIYTQLYYIIARLNSTNAWGRSSRLPSHNSHTALHRQCITPTVLGGFAAYLCSVN